MAAPFPRPPTTRFRGHRLPSSSDEEEQEDRRPRKVARQSRQQAEEEDEQSGNDKQNDSDEDVEEDGNVAPAGDGHTVNPALLSQLLRAVQDADAEEVQGAGQEEEEDENAEEENDDNPKPANQPNPRLPRRASPPPRIGHRIDQSHIARLQATILQPLSSTATGADFSNASNLGYGNRSRAAILVRTRRWSEEVGYATFGDGYDSDGNPIVESDSEDEVEGPDPSQPPVESNATLPSDPWAGDSAYEDAMLDTPSRGRAADMGMSERTPFGSRGSQYVGYLRDGLDPEGADWPDNSPPRRQSQVPGRSHTPGPTDLGEESPYRQGFGLDGAGVGRSDGGEEDGGERGEGETSDDGGQVESDAEDGDGRGAGEQSGDGDGSQHSEPAAGGAEIDEDADEADGDSSNSEQAQAQPTTRRHGPIALTPAGGLPNQEYTGRITRCMAVAQRAHNAPLAPGQGYPSFPIAESQAAQMLLGQFGGEPDSEDDEEDDDNEDGSSGDEDGEVE